MSLKNADEVRELQQQHQARMKRLRLEQEVALLESESKHWRKRFSFERLYAENVVEGVEHLASVKQHISSRATFVVVQPSLQPGAGPHPHSQVTVVPQYCCY